MFFRQKNLIVADSIARVKAAYPSGTTPPENGNVLILANPPGSTWVWDVLSSATDGSSAISIGASPAGGRFVRQTQTLADINLTISNANLDGTGTARPPTTHSHPITQINAFTISQLNTQISDGNVDAAGTPRPPTAHEHPITDLTASGSTDGHVLTVSSGEVIAAAPAAPSAHTHPYTQITAAGEANGSVLAVEDGAIVVAAASTPGPHTHPISDINTFTISALNDRISGTGVDAAGTARPPTTHSHPINQIDTTGSTAGHALVVSGSTVSAAQRTVTGTTAPINAGGVAASGSDQFTSARIDHRHDWGKVASSNVTPDGSGVASIGATDGDYVTIAGGSSTISSFGSNTEQRRILLFVGARTLVNNAGLAIPGGSNLSVPSGSFAVVQGLGSTNWRVLQAWRANGTSLFETSQVTNSTSPPVGGVPELGASELAARDDHSHDIGRVAPSMAVAATVNIAEAEGSYVELNGSGSISSFGPNNGQLRFVRINSNVLISHGANLALPGERTIQTTVGDVLVMQGLGGTAWRCLCYTRADGRSLDWGAVGANTGSSSTTVLVQPWNSELVNVSGNNTINSFGPNTGQLRIVRFTGNATVAHNATSMVLPGGANITAQVGDIALVLGMGSDNWRCVSWQRADGTPIYAPYLPLAGGTMNSGALVNMNEGIVSNANAYRFDSLSPTPDPHSTEGAIHASGGLFRFLPSEDAVTLIEFTIRASRFELTNNDWGGFNIPSAPYGKDISNSACIVEFTAIMTNASAGTEKGYSSTGSNRGWFRLNTGATDTAGKAVLLVELPTAGEMWYVPSGVTAPDGSTNSSNRIRWRRLGSSTTRYGFIHLKAVGII